MGGCSGQQNGGESSGSSFPDYWCLPPTHTPAPRKETIRHNIHVILIMIITLYSADDYHMILYVNQLTITWATSADHMTLYNVRWQSHELCQPITWHYTISADNHMSYSADHMTLYNTSWQSHELRQSITWHYTMWANLCHPFFSNFCGEAEWSEPGCILSWCVRFEDIDESKKERKGGEACWVGEREGGRERGR